MLDSDNGLEGPSIGGLVAGIGYAIGQIAATLPGGLFSNPAAPVKGFEAFANEYYGERMAQKLLEEAARTRPPAPTPGKPFPIITPFPEFLPRLLELFLPPAVEAAPVSSTPTPPSLAPPTPAPAPTPQFTLGRSLTIGGRESTVFSSPRNGMADPAPPAPTPTEDEGFPGEEMGEPSSESSSSEGNTGDGLGEGGVGGFGDAW